MLIFFLSARRGGMRAIVAFVAVVHASFPSGGFFLGVFFPSFFFLKKNFVLWQLCEAMKFDSLTYCSKGRGKKHWIVVAADIYIVSWRDTCYLGYWDGGGGSKWSW